MSKNYFIYLGDIEQLLRHVLELINGRSKGISLQKYTAIM